MTRQAFVQKHWALAVAVGAQFDLHPVAILAHALKESGANNERAAARHNYFGFLKGGKHVVYPSDEAGFTAYARRLTTTWPAAARLSHDAAGFAARLAFAAKPSYVNEGPEARQRYARTLASIYRSVAKDVDRLGLELPQVAGTAPPDVNVI